MRFYYTNRPKIEVTRSDLSFTDKKKNFRITDVAIPDDGGVGAKEDEKVEKYQDLAREIQKWGDEDKGHN